MEFEWNSDFETGNEYVDLQHRYFLDLITRIRKNFEETDDVAYKERLISELRKYIDFHFTSEENMARAHNLPAAVTVHHERHLELLEEFNHHAEDLAKDSKTIDEFLSFLTDWFVGHTIYEDQQLFEKSGF